MPTLPADVVEDQIARVIALLRQRPCTARTIMRELECCKPTAYRRLAEARRREHVRIVRLREGATGPLSRAYSIG